MKSYWLQKKGRDDLIVFCSGWGMDQNPVLHMKSETFDVLTLWNYTDFDCQVDFQELFSKYRSCTLVGWSMGVWAGQKLFSKFKSHLSRAIAINGTLCPIDDHFGIPTAVYTSTQEQYSEQTRLKFYKRMCRRKSILDTFLLRQPQRSVQDQIDELAVLKNSVNCLPARDSIYRDILISTRDLVVPTKNQVSFWQAKEDCKIILLDEAHYPFTTFDNWEQLMDMWLPGLPSSPAHQ